MMKNIKDLLIIPKDGGPAFMAEIDSNDLNPGDIAMDWDKISLIKKLMQETTTVPVSNDPKVLEQRADFLRRHGMFLDHRPINASEAGMEYLKRFRSVNSKEGRQSKKTITELELKRLIVDECNEKAGKEGKVFKWTNDVIFMVRNMMYYFGNHPDCDWPYEKGLLLSGNVGIGKTWIFEIFQQIAYKHMRAGGKRFKMANCRKVYDDYTEDKNSAREKYLSGSWCLDDLGNEPLEHKNYGNSVLPVEEILISRHSHFVSGNHFTHISTNLSLDEIQDRYGLRMFDRLMQMCHPVEWDGKSKRT